MIVVDFNCPACNAPIHDIGCEFYQCSCGRFMERRNHITGELYEVPRLCDEDVKTEVKRRKK